MSRKLIINADDYGLSGEVNDAIENLITAGRLNSVSLITNSWSYEGAVRFLKARPECSVGVHLNVVEGFAISSSNNVKILLNGNGRFVDLKGLFLQWIKRPFAVAKAVEAEWRAQIELLLGDGLIPTHADSHQHIHAFPPFWRILVKLCREFDIPAVRVPRERNRTRKRRLSAFLLNSSASVSQMIMPARDILQNAHFLGFKRAGAYSLDALLADIPRLKNGVTELVIHPSLYDGLPYPELRGGMEYEALLDNDIRELTAEHHIELTSWFDLIPAKKTEM